MGFLEATFYPGAVYLISRWYFLELVRQTCLLKGCRYKREELGYRTALFTAGIGVSNAFGSLLASGILGTMEGFLGYAAWRLVTDFLFLVMRILNVIRWLFFTEGFLTVLVGICGVFILPDFPSAPARWLTPAEHALAQQRMEEDSRSHDLAGSKSSAGLSDLLSLITDWRAWLVGTALGCCNASLSFNMFFPTLAATMGYSPTISLLLCAPPWIISTITAVTVARYVYVSSLSEIGSTDHLSSHSDATRERFWHMVFALSMLIIGYVLAMSTMNITVRYISLLVIFAYSSICLLLLFNQLLHGAGADCKCRRTNMDQ